MLDLGFEFVICVILSICCKVRQIVMFSVMWLLVVFKLVMEFMNEDDFVKVMVGFQDLVVNYDVMQIVEVIEDRV